MEHFLMIVGATGAIFFALFVVHAIRIIRAVKEVLAATHYVVRI